MSVDLYINLIDKKQKKNSSLYLLKEILQINEKEILYEFNRKPYVIGKKHFNISHSKNMLIIAVAKNRIGVDMEHLRQKQFASETYSVLYPNNINKLEKWVLLESYNKLLGIGFTKGINLLFNPLHIQSFKRFKEYQYNNTHMYSHFLNETCCIAICYYSALKEQDIAIHKLY